MLYAVRCLRRAVRSSSEQVLVGTFLWDAVRMRWRLVAVWLASAIDHRNPEIPVGPLTLVDCHQHQFGRLMSKLADRDPGFLRLLRMLE